MPAVLELTDELGKRVYAPWEIDELHNVTTPGLNVLAAKGSARLGGTGFYGAANTQGNHGYGHIRPGDPIPQSRQTRDRQWVARPQVLAGSFQLDGLAMAIGSGDPMTFANIYDHNVSSLLKQMMRFKNQILYKDGSGLMATFVTPVDDSVGPHVMDDVSGFVEGQVVDVMDATATTRHVSDAKVVAVDWPTNSLTFDKPIPAAVDAGDRLFIADSQAASGAILPKDPIGLAGSILSTGEYLGINRDEEANWRAINYSVGKFLDEDVIMRIRTRIHVETGISLQEMGGEFVIALHPMQLDVLFRLAIPRIQYAAGGGFELGHDGSFTFGGMKFLTDYNCPPSVAYVGDWMYHQTLYTPGGELHIDTEYNGAALKWVDGYDQGIVVAKSYYTFVNRKPVCFARLYNLTEVAR